MKKRDAMILGAAAGFGAITGIRNMAGPAFALQVLRRRGRGILRARVAFGLAAVLEMVADKLPFVPARTKAGPLLGRAATGAAIGWFLGSRRARVGAALLGAAAAAVSAVTAVRLRRAATQRGVPDLAIGLGEDIVVATAGNALLHALRA